MRLVSFAFPAATLFNGSHPEFGETELIWCSGRIKNDWCNLRAVDGCHGGGNCQGFLDSWTLAVLTRLSGDDKEFCEHGGSLVLKGNEGCSRNRFREHHEVSQDREIVAQVL